MSDFLAPTDAIARFGELVDEIRVHQQFETPEGIWKPVFDAGLRLEGYRLYRGPRKLVKKVAFRPKGTKR